MIVSRTQGLKCPNRFRTFNPQGTNLLKVTAVDVRVHPEKSPDDGFHRVTEIPRERDT